MFMSLHSRGFYLCGILGILLFIVLHSLWVNFCMWCRIVVAVEAPRPVSYFAIPWTGAHQASLSFTISQSLLKLMSMESVMPSNHLILIPPSLSALNLSQHQNLIQWVISSHKVATALEFQLQYQSFQWIFRLISFRIGCFDLLAVQRTLKSFLQHHNLKTSIL